MADERFEPTPDMNGAAGESEPREEAAIPVESPEGQAIEENAEPVAQDVVTEETAEDQATAEAPAAEAELGENIPEWGAPRPPVYESAVYNTAPSGGDGGQPPVWGPPPQSQSNPGGPRINMQVKKKKKRRWIPVLITCLVVFYVALTAVLVVGVGRAVRGLNVHFDPATGMLEIQSSLGRNPTGAQPQDQDDTNVEEHLQIQDTPESSDPASPDGKLTVKEIAKKVRSSVVGVIAEGSANFNNSSVGSGIIMSADGYIITNNHVIDSMNKITVVLDDSTNYTAYVVGTDSRTDLAVLKIDADNLPAASFGDSEKLEQGDLAVAIGNPAGIQLQNTVTTGVISAINRNIVVEDEEMTLIQTDASINPGNSGGPLVNEYGQVIGINTVKIGVSYYEGLGFAIPINTAKPIIDELISRGYVKGRPSIGINGTMLTEREATFYGLAKGMYVDYVHPNSDAYKKGLQAGDVITKMNGKDLSSTEEIKKIRDEHKAGDTITLTVFRQGKTLDLSVILMDEAELNKIGQPTQGSRN